MIARRVCEDWQSIILPILVRINHHCYVSITGLHLRIGHAGHAWGAKLAEDPRHTLEDSCRYVYGEDEVYRRNKEELGQRTKAGPCRDPAIPAVGVADGNPIIDDLGLDIDVDDAISALGVMTTPVDDRVATGEETLGIMRGGVFVVTKEEIDTSEDIFPFQNPSELFDLVDLIEDAEDHDGYSDRLALLIFREQRIANARRALGLTKPKHARGDQADQAAAEYHRTIDVVEALQLFSSEGDGVIGKVLQRLHVKRYHCEPQRLQSLLRAAGALPKACNLVPQVVQSCQVCRPWRRPGQCNNFIHSLAFSLNEEVQFDFIFYHSGLEFGLGGSHGIPILH